MLVLEPRNIKERFIKLQQQNKRLLMENEVLEFNQIEIDETWDFDLDPKYIKTKGIFAIVELVLNNIPSWMRDMEIVGSFYCSQCNLTSLKNCPKIIHQYFSCDYNKLNSLHDGPTYVGNNYYCFNNDVKFTEEYVRSICDVKGKILV